MRRPGVERHVGEHARPVEESRLGRDDQQGGFGKQDQNDQRGRESRVRAEEAGENTGKKAGIERLAGLVFDLIQQIAEQDAARRESQRGGHVKHGLFAGFHARLTQDLQPVADCFDAGVSAAAETVSVQ